MTDGLLDGFRVGFFICEGCIDGFLDCGCKDRFIDNLALGCTVGRELRNDERLLLGLFVFKDAGNIDGSGIAGLIDGMVIDGRVEGDEVDLKVGVYVPIL